mmetsp:Transcript_73303/g.159004  ORF Transcript_73303/g.159004 Transcript_73303/m.159004 type:complete len:131 (-) Transcript_73303:329-721(-)
MGCATSKANKASAGPAAGASSAVPVLPAAANSAPEVPSPGKEPESGPLGGHGAAPVSIEGLKAAQKDLAGSASNAAGGQIVQGVPMPTEPRAQDGTVGEETVGAVKGPGGSAWSLCCCVQDETATQVIVQ